MRPLLPALLGVAGAKLVPREGLQLRLEGRCGSQQPRLSLGQTVEAGNGPLASAGWTGDVDRDQSPFGKTQGIPR